MNTRDGEPRPESDSQPPVRPLVIPVAPFPDESLAGLVARSAELNVLGHTSVILRDVGVPLMRPAWIGTELGPHATRLAEKLGCDASGIEARSHPYDGQAGRSARMRWGGSTILRSDLNLNSRRVSPATLATQSHHVTAWLLTILPYCPISFERLVDWCNACGERLGWRGARGIGTCEACRRPVTHPDGETLPTEVRCGYSRFAELLSAHPEAREAALRTVAPSLAALSTDTLVDLVVSLGRVMVPGAVGLRRDRISATPPVVTAKVFAAGIDMISDWPARFRMHLANKHASADAAERSIIHSLQWRARNRGGAPDAEILREALPELFRQGRKSLSSLTLPMMEPVEFRKRTGMSNAQWRTLHTSGALGKTESTGAIRVSARITRLEAERFIARKDRSAPAAKLKQSLGLPTYAVEQLACLGEIQHVDHPGFRALGMEIRICSESSAALIADLGAACADPPKGTRPILHLAARFCGGEKPWAAIIAALRSGGLPYWLLPETRDNGKWRRPLMRRILVRPQDFARSSAVSFVDAAHPDFPFETATCQKDALEVLGTTMPQLSDAIRAGEISFRKGSGNTIVADRARVLELARLYVGPTELGFRADIDRNHLVEAWVRERSHIVRHPLGWLRTELEEEFSHLFPNEASDRP